MLETVPPTLAPLRGHCLSQPCLTFLGSKRMNQTGSLELLSLTRPSSHAVILGQTGTPLSLPGSGFWFLLHLLQALSSA